MEKGEGGSDGEKKKVAADAHKRELSSDLVYPFVPNFESACDDSMAREEESILPSATLEHSLTNLPSPISMAASDPSPPLTTHVRKAKQNFTLNSMVMTAVVPCVAQNNETAVKELLQQNFPQGGSPLTPGNTVVMGGGDKSLMSLSSQGFAWENNSFDTDLTRASQLNLYVMDEGNRLRFQNNWRDEIMVCARYSVPPKAATYYCEVAILKKPSRQTHVAVGLVGEAYPSSRLPGMDVEHPLSISYESISGKLWVNGNGCHYAEPFGEGDVIGVGIKADEGLVFFTKNGVDLGMAVYGFAIGEKLWPCVGARGRLEVGVNFGKWQFRLAM